LISLFLQQNEERHGQNNQPAYLKHAARTDKSSSKPSIGLIKRTGDQKKNGTKTVRTDTAQKLFYLFFQQNKERHGRKLGLFCSQYQTIRERGKKKKRARNGRENPRVNPAKKAAILEKLVTKKGQQSTRPQNKSLSNK
jgi:hypothetical protein